MFKICLLNEELSQKNIYSLVLNSNFLKLQRIKKIEHLCLTFFALHWIHIFFKNFTKKNNKSYKN